MVVAVGYKSMKPPVEVKSLLSGKLMRMKSIVGIHGFLTFIVQDLNCYRDKNNGILPVISDNRINWKLENNLLIGEV